MTVASCRASLSQCRQVSIDIVSEGEWEVAPAPKPLAPKPGPNAHAPPPGPHQLDDAASKFGFSRPAQVRRLLAPTAASCCIFAPGVSHVSQTPDEWNANQHKVAVMRMKRRVLPPCVTRLCAAGHADGYRHGRPSAPGKVSGGGWPRALLNVIPCAAGGSPTRRRRATRLKSAANRALPGLQRRRQPRSKGITTAPHLCGPTLL